MIYLDDYEILTLVQWIIFEDTHLDLSISASGSRSEGVPMEIVFACVLTQFVHPFQVVLSFAGELSSDMDSE